MRIFEYRTSGRLTLAILLAVAMTVGCRTPQAFRAQQVAASSNGLSPIATIVEAENHHKEVRFLDEISQLAITPSLEAPLELFREAEAARHRSDPQCVSLYAHVALACWPLLPPSDQTHATEVTFSDDSGVPRITEQPKDSAWLLYHHSLERLTETAMKFEQLDLQRGISIVTPNGEKAFIEITRHGFPWSPGDFNEMQVVKSPLRSHLKRYWSDPGLGVPLVAIRQRSESGPHMGKTIPYAATAVLRPATNEGGSVVSPVSYSSAPTIGVLELHDPLRITQFTDSRRAWDLARDVSAPLGLAQSQLHRDKLKSFLNPDRTDEFAGLRMLEPYQRGKIPIVFVHGLLSDRVTWIDLINDLRHSPWIGRNYQIWLYQYATGQPFVVSAAQMRSTLHEAVQEMDPQGSDEAISQMVLVGHSMGGLVSKLLITESRTELWDSIANVPANEVKITPEKRAEVNAIFFFEPLPYVKRVVFIGSPHQGSKIAKSWIGVLGSTLVHRSKDRTRATKTVLHDNPGVFKDLEKHLPTSIDLLRPDNPILNATYRLPVNPGVSLHTILGTGHPLRDGTPADGVVPVESAMHPGTKSEKRIETNHTGLPDHPDTTREVARILNEHLQR